MSDPFEKHIKQSLENYEAQYNPADWTDLQNKLSKAKAGNSNLGKGLMIAASLAVVAGAIYYFSSTNSKNTAGEKTTTAQQGVSLQTQESPVQQIETNNSQPSGSQNHPQSAQSSGKEKVIANNNIAENKSIASEKIESQHVNTAEENKTPVQEQSKTSVTPQLPSNPASGISFHANKTKVCPGETVQFSNENVTDGSCRWDFGDGENSTEPNPNHIYKEAGTYLVKLRFTSKEQKSAEQLMKNTITVLPPPVINMDYTSTDELIPVINFEARAEGVYIWKWEFGDKTTSSDQNPEHTYNKKGNYDVTTTGKNSSGCTTTIHRNIKYAFKLLAPTGFSPNGDGRNDTWLPVALLNEDYTFTLTIMDQTGTTIIYETSDKDHPWDGANTHPGDTFQWKIIVKDKNGKEISDRGVITIAE